jgi:hypothetical protein
MSGFLKRYTDLPFLFDYLRTKELALLSPRSWDDKNDSHYIEVYAQSKGCTGTYALCLTEATETYHHWKVFTSGASGVCLEFDKDALLSCATKVSGLRAEAVHYRTMGEIRKLDLKQEQLPFLKRKAFCDESEFRFFLANNDTSNSVIRFHVPASAIRRIMLSPWIPVAVANRVKESVQSMIGCKSIKISRSSLVDNEKWKEFATSTDRSACIFRIAR